MYADMPVLTWKRLWLTGIMYSICYLLIMQQIPEHQSVYERNNSELTPVDNIWQTVVHNNVYVYSAFLDERLTQGEIQMLAIVRTNLFLTTLRQVYDKKYCVITYKDHNLRDVVPATEQLLRVDFNFKFSPVFYRCQSDVRFKPSSVSLVDTSSSSQLNAVSVTNPRQCGHQIKYTICIAPLHGVSDTNQLAEFIEMNRILGVQKFVFYIMNNLNNSAEFLDMLKFYNESGLVDIYNWDHAFGEKVHYYGQISAQNDCMYRYMYRSEYVAFVDVDELIIPRGTMTTWDELLHTLHVKLGNQKGKTCAFTFLKNNFYTRYENKGTLSAGSDTASKLLPKGDWADVLRQSSDMSDIGHLVYKHDIKSLRSFLRNGETDPGNLNKLIVNPRKIYSLDVHHVEFSLEGEQTYHVSNETASVHHYRVPWTNPHQRVSMWKQITGFFIGPANHLTSDNTMVKYADELTKRIVNTKRMFEKWNTNNKGKEGGNPGV